jgi:hypothetical protein
VPISFPVTCRCQPSRAPEPVGDVHLDATGVQLRDQGAHDVVLHEGVAPIEQVGTIARLIGDHVGEVHRRAEVARTPGRPR